MLRTFFSRSLSRTAHANTSSSVSAERFVGLERPSVLLQPAHRQQALHQVAAITALPPERYRSLVLTVIERYAGFVQRLPASEARHHAGLGGMLDHGLEVALQALLIRRGKLLPVGAEHPLPRSTRNERVGPWPCTGAVRSDRSRSEVSSSDQVSGAGDRS